MLYLALLLVVLMPLTQYDDTFVVTIYDIDNAPVTAQITLRDSTNQYVLAEGTTDAEGTARFEGVSESVLSVMVAGELADGTPLQLIGMDEDGINFTLGPGPNRLDLVVEPNGIIRINPSMFVGDNPANAPTPDPFPTAPVSSTVAPDPTAPPALPTETRSATPEIAPTSPALAEAVEAPLQPTPIPDLATGASRAIGVLSVEVLWCIGFWVLLGVLGVIAGYFQRRNREMSE